MYELMFATLSRLVHTVTKAPLGASQPIPGPGTSARFRTGISDLLQRVDVVAVEIRVVKTCQ